jgi:hypothetical protein
MWGGGNRPKSKRVALIWSATRAFNPAMRASAGGSYRPTRLNYRTWTFTSFDGGR